MNFAGLHVDKEGDTIVSIASGNRLGNMQDYARTMKTHREVQEFLGVGLLTELEGFYGAQKLLDTETKNRLENLEGKSKE